MKDCRHLTSFLAVKMREICLQQKSIYAPEVWLRAIFLAKIQMEERKYDFVMTQKGVIVHWKQSFDFNM